MFKLHIYSIEDYSANLSFLIFVCGSIAINT